MGEDGMGERPTDTLQPERGSTAPSVGKGGRREQALVDTRPSSFEHRRLVTNARRKLFGRGSRLQIGRYRVEHPLGAGGMGEVYLAYDEDLGRRVAVKRVLGSSDQERHQRRLRQEARALARLSHPNVVQVYEVGEHEGRTFVAMEYVEGQTLGEWLADELRSWRDVVQRFLAAGRGLAAAHQQGLVHRDFKPDNVLLGRDGSVRVADFGLALAGAPSQPESVAQPASASSPVTGPLRGTIRYMPLEQVLGTRVNARSDQFSFCVALYEALWGSSPFSMESVVDRVQQLRSGTPATPQSPRGHRVPRSLWRIVRRGLQRDPDERWDDMGALLDALGGVLNRRRRWLRGGSMVVVAGLGVAGVLRAEMGTVEPCAEVDSELHATWGDEPRARLEAELSGLRVGHADESCARVVEGLDRWAEQWQQQREATCHAAAEKRVEPRLGQLRSACLARQRWQVEDLVAALVSSPDGDTLARAVESVAALPLPSACEDQAILLGVEPPPASLGDEIEDLRRDLARVEQLRGLGMVDQALTAAERSEREAATLGYGPLLAEARAELAWAELDGGSLAHGLERLQQAIDTAELHRHDRLAARLWITLSLRTLVELRQSEAGARRLRRAEVAVGRAGSTVHTKARLAFGQAQLADLRGDEAEAERGYREALEQLSREPTVSVDRASYLSNLARAVSRRDPAEGLTLYRAAVAVAEQVVGPRHPHTAEHLYQLAVALRARDPADPEIVPLLDAASDIWTEAHARPHRDLAKVELLLAIDALTRGEPDEAQGHADRLVEIQAARDPDDPGLRGETAHLLSGLYGLRGQPKRALEQLEIALQVWEPTFGADSAAVIRLRSQRIAYWLELGRLDDAADEVQVLLPEVEGTGAEITLRIHRAELALRRGDLALAAGDLEAIESRALGAYAFSHALLKGLVELRRGALPATSVTRIRHARRDTSFLPEQIRRWLDQLEVTTSERTALALD